MPRFCNQCGRALQNGEICQCSNQGYRQADPRYGQQADPRYRQPDPGYGQQADPRYRQPDPRYGQQADPRYRQSDPGYGQQIDPRYAQQGSQYGYNTSNGGQKAKEFANGLKGFIKGTFSLYKSPMEVLDYYYKENNIWSAVYMITSYLAMVLFFMIIMSLRISIMIYSKIREFVRDIDLSVIKNYMPDIPYFTIILLAIVLMVIYFIAMSGVVFGLTKIFSKAEASFAKAMVVVGGRQWYMTLFLAISSVLAIIHPKGGAIGISIGMAVLSVFELVSFCELIEMKSSNKFYALILYYIAKAILLSLCMGLYMYFMEAGLEQALNHVF